MSENCGLVLPSDYIIMCVVILLDKFLEDRIEFSLNEPKI